MRHSMVKIFAVSVCLTGCGGNGPVPVVPTAASPAPAPAPPPTLTRTVSGTVAEVDGGPVAGAAVTTAYSPRAFTDATGAFSLRYPGAVSPNLLTVDATGFEIRQYGWSSGSADVTLGTIRLQRTMLLTEMSSLAGIISPNDLPDYVGEPYESDYCSPCRPLRLRLSVKQNVRVELKWSGGAALQLWARVKDEGPGDVVTAAAVPGQSTLVLNVPARQGDTVLRVGLPLLGRSIQHLEAPVSFEVTTQPALP